jgi:hypothetical protein
VNPLALSAASELFASTTQPDTVLVVVFRGADEFPDRAPEETRNVTFSRTPASALRTPLADTATANHPASAASPVPGLPTESSLSVVSPRFEGLVGASGWHLDGHRLANAGVPAGWLPSTVAPGLRLDGQSAGAARPVVWAAGDEGEVSWVPNALPRIAPRELSPQGESEILPPGVARETEDFEAPAVLPASARPGPMSMLPPVPLTILEAGLQQFLEQLDRAGQALAGDQEGSGLWAWIVAGAAVAVACEMGRRELRRPDAVPTEPPFRE